ncbi:hypothetical protein B0H14DRAFT_2860298 [Mycena olivaceomarginata]|nr:hypothetical protein B0H14DRAFT_2860298 [Mycena olivaceomarginata]
MGLTSHKKGKLSTFEPGDLVLGKIRGHTAWPGIVVDPVRKSSIGGVRRASYYAVVFFPAYDHAWLSPNNISKVDREWLEKAVNNPATRRTAILAGYKEALDYALSKTQNGSTLEPSSVTSTSELPGGDGHAFQVRKWRYDLQRTFLGNLVPKSEDIAKADAKLNAIDESDYLVFSKLPKVLRHIHRLSASQVPGDEQYNFRHRAGALVEKWLNQFQSST